MSTSYDVAQFTVDIDYVDVDGGQWEAHIADDEAEFGFHADSIHTLLAAVADEITKRVETTP